MPESTNQQLHVFRNDVVDTVIAYSPRDAIRVWEETVGETYDEICGEFTQVPDEIEYTLYEEETINPEPIPDGAVLVENGEYSHTYCATCRAWADARGRCFLGSDEY